MRNIKKQKQNELKSIRLEPNDVNLTGDLQTLQQGVDQKTKDLDKLSNNNKLIDPEEFKKLQIRFYRYK